MALRQGIPFICQNIFLFGLCISVATGISRTILDQTPHNVLPFEDGSINSNPNPNHENRQKRQANSVHSIFTAESSVTEDVFSNVSLFDLSRTHFEGTFTPSGNSAGVATMFVIKDGTHLHLNDSLTETERTKFDFEAFPVFDVNVTVLTEGSPNEVTITIQIPLSDVNDEPPVFQTEATPILAQVGSDVVPWTMVCKMEARDEDTYPDLVMALVAVEPKEFSSRFRFQQDSRSSSEIRGSIVVAGSDILPASQELTLLVIVEDRNTSGRPQVTSAKVQVLVGVRPPQFYRPDYTGWLSESVLVGDRNRVTIDGFEPLIVKVVNFNPSLPVEIRLLEMDRTETRRFELSPDGQVINTQVIDFETTRKVTLTLEASNPGSDVTNTSQLHIVIVDQNDHSPEFNKDNYFGRIKENAAIDSIVLQVTAGDRDSGANGDLEFVLTDVGDFDIESSRVDNVFYGKLKATHQRALDYDSLEIPVLTFPVYVKDRGIPDKTATAHVVVTLENVNDNPPIITVDGSHNGTIGMMETLAPGSVLTVVQASDADGDGVTFSFHDGGTTQDIFTIHPVTGVITTTGPVDTSRDAYQLRLKAVDDGACCPEGTTLTSTAALEVTVIDINLNKPTFASCVEYDMRVSLMEGSAIGTNVTVVTATDGDRGENGVVLYEIEGAANSPFSIDERTGHIVVKEKIVREPNGYEQVTVIGKNPGLVPLMMGWCSFRVRIEDLNDHDPKFSYGRYDAEVLGTANTNQEVVKMLATDGDVGDNSKISYELLPLYNTSSGEAIFSINETTGSVTLRRPLTSDEMGRVFEHTVRATDHGIDPGPLTGMTRLHIAVVDRKANTPSWTFPQAYEEFFVDETVGSGHVITNLTCRSNYPPDPRVFFVVYNAEDDVRTASKTFGTSRLGDSSNTASLVTLGSDLDFEKRRTYFIHITCQDYSNDISVSQLTLKISLTDANDEIPRFVGLVVSNDGNYVGSAPEGADPGAFVTYVQAVDDDTNPRFKNISFRIVGEGREVFNISQISDNHASIVTNQRLDREQQDTYNVEIEVQDGAPSANGGPGGPNRASRRIQVKVTDINDNPPSFPKDLYSHNVSEAAKVNDVIFHVTAQDNDTVDARLDYVFVSGNDQGMFSILSGSGEIRVARKLNYDVMDDKVYRLTLQARDQGAIHSATTSIELRVTDENDSPPTFTSAAYEVKGTAVEHDASVTKDNPLRLIQVLATDQDRRQETDIRYSLLNPSLPMQILFVIDRLTGSLSLTGVLDRDRLETFYTVALQAEDERSNPLYGYTEVKVYPIDVNERPVFEREDLEVSLKENSPLGTSVTTIVATDTDLGPNKTLRYALMPESAPFQINPTSGDLYTTVVFDAEETSKLSVTVIARDRGVPSLSASMTVTVVISDVNDKRPTFVEDHYNISISENVIGQVVVNQPIRVEDDDVDDDNRQLVYSIHGDQNGGRFFIQPSSDDSSTAFIGVNSTHPLDHEKGPRLFSLTITVTDGKYSANALLTVWVVDYNDNAPVIQTGGQLNITLADGTPEGTAVATFNATDADEGINAETRFSIQRQSDPRHEFYIHPDHGTLVTRKVLDREIQPVVELVVMATDKGEIPLSSSVTLTITFKDTNDWAPQLREPYHPTVEENVPNKDRLVVEIFAVDPDTLPYGPPFGFKLPDSCDDPPACQLFRLEMNRDGDGGNGTALIWTDATFDREFQKVYQLPIVTWDKRDMGVPSQTATHTLTITIADQNDNRHYPGHQDIHVYNYRGTKSPKHIGRVYAKDSDDWDLQDKTFMAELSPLMAVYFSVERDTGMITMYENVPPNSQQPFPTYDFDVQVEDVTKGLVVTCSVSVLVEDLSDQAVRNAGSVRLTGITAEEFIHKNGQTDESKYDRFRQKLSSILGYDTPTHVQIVSIQAHDGNHLDVRFSAHGSPYLQPSQMESAIMLTQKEFESDVGVTIAMLPINPCMEEVYDVGCSAILEVTQEANVVIANGTGFAGVQVRSTAVSECRDCLFPTPDSCNGGYCYNGGTCLRDDWGKISCQCLPGFDGPRCQQTRHHFDGSSVAFYPSLSVCASCRTSLDFISVEEDGVIMSAGVVQAGGDYVIMELQSGYPRLQINLGSGELVLTLDGRDQSGNLAMGKLSDGKWHHLDIDRNGQSVKMTVDKCQWITDVTSHPDTVYDWTPCLTSGIVPGPNVLLNTPGFLHVGGMYPSSSTSKGGFSGCLKNLVHNSKLYDLYYKDIPTHNSGQANCPREDEICSRETICGEKADCVTEWLPSNRVVSCSCHSGWKGDNCNEETPVKDFDTASFLKWDLRQHLTTASPRTQRIFLMFRTRQTTGTLFSLTNDRLDSIVIQLSDGKLEVVYSQDAGREMETVSLENTRVATGQWHSLQVERFDREVSIGLNNGEGRNLGWSVLGKGMDDAVMDFLPFFLVSSGARINHVIQGRVGDEDFRDKDLVSTCITDVRYNDESLPMDTTPGNKTEAVGGATLVEYSDVTDGCSRQDCVTDNCQPGTICQPLWEAYECRPFPDLCGSCFCYNGGVCLTVNDVTSCQCVFPWVGACCNVSAAALVEQEEDDEVLAAGVIAGIIIAIIIIIILLILVIVILLLRRQKDDSKVTLVEGLQDGDVRESVMEYDEEGAGEKDCQGFNLSYLIQTPVPRIQDYDTKPVEADYVDLDMARGTTGPSTRPLPKFPHIIKDKLNTLPDGDNEDRLHCFADEGEGSTAGSLSSMTSSTGSEVSQDYDYLEGWGPKFSRLAEMYGTDTGGAGS